MKKTLFLLYITVCCFSCRLTDNFDEEPMYLQINSATLAAIPEVGNTHDIRDVWVYVDGFNVGIFELPAKVPILSAADMVSIDLRAGIRDNGIQLTARQYPFYETLNYNFDFVPNQTRELDVTFAYIDAVKFGMSEDFETSNVFSEDVDGDPLSTVVRSTEASYGNYCGKSVVSADLSRYGYFCRD